MATNEKKAKPEDEQLPNPKDAKDVALEGAAEPDSGIVRHAEVEGGDQISIDAGPPSAAGGERGWPTSEEEEEPERQ